MQACKIVIEVELPKDSDRKRRLAVLLEQLAEEHLKYCGSLDVRDRWGFDGPIKGETVTFKVLKGEEA
jgi:hypothetical protein